LKVQFLYLGHPSAKECHMIVMFDSYIPPKFCLRGV
jgi:hypothetical protein